MGSQTAKAASTTQLGIATRKAGSMEAHSERLGTTTQPKSTGAVDRVRRLTTETKQAFKTTEFWAYVVAVIGVLIAGTVDDAEGTQFGADDVWLYVSLLTIGYMIARGLAKAGSRDPYTEDRDDRS
jgi:hypothetical protein